VLCSFNTVKKAKTSTNNRATFSKTYPTAFVIGEYSTTFEKLNDQYNLQLLAVCDNNLDKAYQQWKRTLSDIDRFAQINGMSLKGTKMWIKIYWSKEGQIKHIAYDLKRQSKKISKKKFTQLLKKYIASKPEPFMKAAGRFSHYGSVNYPIQSVPIYAD
jgi:hypothetical protein